jgi:hypothetical protein
MLSPDYQKYTHSGVVLDLPPEQVPPTSWTNCSNMMFKEFATIRSGGYSPYADMLPVPDPIFAMMYLYEGTSYWIYCTPTKIYITDGNIHTDLTPTAPLSISEAGDWTGTTLNGVPVLNNGIDAPIYWDGNFANKFKTLPDWPVNTRCNAIRAFKYHLIAMGIVDNSVEYPHLVKWSSAADPGTIPQHWTPAPDNDAGDTILADTPGKCIDGLPLRDVFVIYKEFSTYVLSYVAGQYVFSARKLFLTSGIQSNNCITEINGEHWVLTTNDVIRHDGQTFKSVVVNKARNAIIESIEPSKIKQCCVVSRLNNQQVWVCIPETGNSWLTKAYIINTEIGSIGTRDLPDVSYVAKGIVKQTENASWDVDTMAWDDDNTFWNQQTYNPSEDSILMVSATDDKLWAVDVEQSANGQPQNAYVERVGMNLGEFTERKLISRVVPRLEGSTGDTIYISVGGQSLFNDPVAWSDPLPFVIGTDRSVDCQVDGRLLSVRFEGTTKNIWKLHEYTVEFVECGLY